MSTDPVEQIPAHVTPHLSIMFAWAAISFGTITFIVEIVVALDVVIMDFELLGAFIAMPWLLLASIVLCTVAGLKGGRPRRAGLLVGLALLLPGLPFIFIFVVSMIALSSAS